MKMRPTTDHDRTRLKAATGHSIRRAGGGSALSAFTRVEPPALSKYKADHEADHFMPIDVAVDCDMTAGAPIILSAMASAQGYTVSPVRAESAPLTLDLVGAIIRETGDVSSVVLKALADGRITPAERSAIVCEIDEAQAALWKLRAAVSEG